MTLLPGAIWVGPINPDNYSPTRNGYAISEIIDHHTDTNTWQQALAAFNAAYGSGKGRSAHLIIDRNDPINDVYQCVDLDHMAWGATNYDANLRGVNIEHVRPWDSGYLPITDGQYRKSHDVHVWLSALYGFPLDLVHVQPHSFYTATTCPGDLDLARLIQGGLSVTDSEAIQHLVNQMGTNASSVQNRISSIWDKLNEIEARLPAVGGSIPSEVAADLATIAAAARKLGTP